MLSLSNYLRCKAGEALQLASLQPGFSPTQKPTVKWNTGTVRPSASAPLSASSQGHKDSPYNARISNSVSPCYQFTLEAGSPVVLHSQHPSFRVCLIPWDTIHFPSPGILSDNTLRAIILRERLTQFQASFVFPHGSFVTGRWLSEANLTVCRISCVLSYASIEQRELFCTLSGSQYRNRRNHSSRGQHMLYHIFGSRLIFREETSPDTTIHRCTQKTFFL